MKRIVSILSLVCTFSCSKDYRKIKMTDFSKRRVDTLIPYKYKDYIMYNLKVKGFTNDTVKIRHKGGKGIKLSGYIDTLFQSDYYGTDTIIEIFDPYKAKKGNLEIEYKL